MTAAGSPIRKNGGLQSATHKPLPYRPEVLAIGSSTGGPQALQVLLSSLRLWRELPIFLTQHMPAGFTQVLADQLNRNTPWGCKQGETGDEIKGGQCYLAPGDFHMLIKPQPLGLRLQLEQTPPENYCRPAVDPMLRSLATVYGRKLLVVILTGMGQDGLEGCKVVQKAGGTVIVQDEATSAVWGMPGVVAKAGIAHAVLPLAGMGAYLNENFVRLGVK